VAYSESYYSDVDRCISIEPSEVITLGGFFISFAPSVLGHDPATRPQKNPLDVPWNVKRIA
jgi:hypothetical protein